MAGFVFNNSVPSKNGTNNNSISEVVGNREDFAFSGDLNGDPTIIGHLVANYYHVHKSAKVYPRGDDNSAKDSVTITSGSGSAWLEGSKTEVIASASTGGYAVPMEAYDCHWVLINSVSATDEYVLKLYIGDVGNEVFWGECAFARDTTQIRTAYVPVQGPPIPQGTRLSATLACQDGDGADAQVKVYTHTYAGVTE